MGILENTRHERMAQGLANGLTAAQAYSEAGYKMHRGNAATMAKQEHIRLRVGELLRDRDRLHAETTAKSMEIVGVTKQYVLQRLIENLERAMQKRPVTDENGKIVEYRWEPNAANKSIELLGKEMGMFIDRRETGLPGEFKQLDEMNADQLRDYINREAEAAGLRDGQAAGSAGSGEAGGKPH